MVVPTVLPMAVFSLSGDPVAACSARVSLMVVMIVHISFDMGAVCSQASRCGVRRARSGSPVALPGEDHLADSAVVVEVRDVVLHQVHGRIPVPTPDGVEDVAMFLSDRLRGLPPVLEPGVGLD